MGLADNPVKQGKSNELTLLIPSILDNIRMVESFIDNAREPFHISDEIYGNIVIAVTEAVNNAMLHGNALKKERVVKLTMRFEDAALKFFVKDEGNGFAPEELPDPTAPENLEKETGRGIFLMRHLSDEVNFHETGNQVELVFYLDE